MGPTKGENFMVRVCYDFSKHQTADEAMDNETNGVSIAPALAELAIDKGANGLDLG